MKVLINRNDNLGDIIYTLPMATLLKQHHPQVKVFFLVRPYAQELPGCHPQVDGVITTEDFHEANGDIGKFEIYIGAKHCKQNVKRAKALGIPMRIGNARRLANWRYCSHVVNVNRKRSPLHEAELNARLLKPLLPSDFNYDRNSIMQSTRVKVASSDFAMQHLSTSQKNIVIHPASNGNGREWPPEHMIELMHLLGSQNHRILLTGSANEKTLCQRIRLSYPQAVDLSGQSSLLELLSLLQAADLVIASGTGPLHLAASLGTCSIGLFPPLMSLDKRRWGPRFDWCLNLQQPQCQRQHPCHNKDCACMMQLTPIRVAQAAERLLVKPKATAIANGNPPSPGNEAVA